MEWEYPFGTTYNGMVAMQTTRFMHDNNVSPEEMASIPVAFRKWAELDPNAMYRKPLTVEKVLSTKMISTPLHSMECNMLADGGGALDSHIGRDEPRRFAKRPCTSLERAPAIARRL